ncbi:MAG: chemotaxis protein CheD [Clostridiales bacterium]|nr:chemotaxis protein CheD [Clostridiales bacterium]
MSEVMHTIGISDMKVSKFPDNFVTFALGSCVGICLFDPVLKVAGLGHIMLPEFPKNNPNENKMRFADTCVPLMVNEMNALGASTSRIVAKIAGGARMFEVPNDSTFGNIGERNVIAVKTALQKYNIRILAEDTGANYGRTVYFYSENGTMVVKSFVNGVKNY